MKPAALARCACGRVIIEDSGETYYMFRGEAVCGECLTEYLKNYAGNARLEA